MAPLREGSSHALVMSVAQSQTNTHLQPGSSLYSLVALDRSPPVWAAVSSSVTYVWHVFLED